MASDFLKKLKESVDSGKSNEAIKAGFNEIIEKADKYAADPNALKSIEEKLKKAQDNKKPLTPEEIKELNALAAKQQEQIDLFDEELKAKARLQMVQDDIKFEKQSKKLKAEKKIDDEITLLREKIEELLALKKALNSNEFDDIIERNLDDSEYDGSIKDSEV